VRWVAAVLAVLVLAASGGIAYACQVGPPCQTGWYTQNGKCVPSVDIVWENPSGVLPGALVLCALTLTPQELTVVVSHLGPGTSCTFHASLANVGKYTVSLTESVSISAPSKCRLFTYSDNIPSSPPRQLKAGAEYAFAGTVGLKAGAGTACEGAVATFSVIITGTCVCSCVYDRNLSGGGAIRSPE